MNLFQQPDAYKYSSTYDVSDRIVEKCDHLPERFWPDALYNPETEIVYVKDGPPFRLFQRTIHELGHHFGYTHSFQSLTIDKIAQAVEDNIISVDDICLLRSHVGKYSIDSREGIQIVQVCLKLSQRFLGIPVDKISIDRLDETVINQVLIPYIRNGDWKNFDKRLQRDIELSAIYYEIFMTTFLEKAENSIFHNNQTYIRTFRNNGSYQRALNITAWCFERNIPAPSMFDLKHKYAETHPYLYEV